MAEFSIANMSLAGIRIVWQRPAAMFVWALIQMIASLSIVSLAIMLAGPELSQIAASFADPADEAAQTPLVTGNLILVCLGLLALFMSFTAVLSVAMTRAVMQPEASLMGYVQFGAAELRQLPVIGFFYFALATSYLFASQVVQGVATGVASLLGVSSAAPEVMGVALGACAAVFVFIRLALSTSLTFETGRVNLFGSWSLTRGRFWSLLGVYGLIAVMITMIALVSVIVVYLALALMGDRGELNLVLHPHPDLSSLGAFFTRVALVKLVLRAFASAVVWPLIVAPQAAIYLAITRRTA